MHPHRVPDPGRRRLRRVAVVAVAVAMLIGGIVAARVLRAVPLVASTADAVDRNPANVPGSWERAGIGPRIDGVRVVGDRALVVSFVGSPGANTAELGVCELAYQATVLETDHEVSVSLTSYRRPTTAPVMCSGIGARRSLQIGLAAPLGDRVVHDSVGDVVPRSG